MLKIYLLKRISPKPKYICNTFSSISCPSIFYLAVDNSFHFILAADIVTEFSASGLDLTWTWRLANKKIRSTMYLLKLPNQQRHHPLLWIISWSDYDENFLRLPYLGEIMRFWIFSESDTKKERHFRRHLAVISRQLRNHKRQRLI